eukprot:236525-Chlamydomonas_euryale.AAC.1
MVDRPTSRHMYRGQITPTQDDRAASAHSTYRTTPAPQPLRPAPERRQTRPHARPAKPRQSRRSDRAMP